MSYQQQAERTDTAVPLELVVSGDGGVAGLTAVVAVREGGTADNYLDFADLTFRTSGWTTQQAALADLGAGRYAFAGGLDLTAITGLPTSPQLVAEYSVSGTISGEASDLILLRNHIYDLAIPGDAMDLIAGAVDAAAIATDAITAAKIAADAIGASELAASAVAEIRDAILSDSTAFDGADIAATRLAAERVNYLGCIWIDTTNGIAGTTVGVNGLPGNPVDTLADALALSTATGLRCLVVITGSLLLTASLTEFLVELRDESEIDFGGQNINGTEFRGGVIKGTMTGVITARGSLLEDVSGFRGNAMGCGLMGTITIGAGTATFDRCRSNVPGTATPTIAFAHATAECNLRAYSGGLQVEDMTAAAHLMSAEFVAGQIIIDSSCTGGTLVIRGVVGPIIDGSAGTSVVVTGEISKLSLADFLETTGPNPHGTDPWDEALPTVADIANAVWGRSVDDGEFTFPAAGRMLNRILRYGTLPRRLNLATQKLEIGADSTFAVIVQSWDIETITGAPQLVIDQFGSPAVRLDPDVAL